MRQVPRYCIIGHGKMGKHFAHYLSTLKIPFELLTRQHITATSIKNALETCDKMCLLISDDAIESFIDHVQIRNHPKIVHFSGAKIIEGCYSAHPLMTFGIHFYEDTLYSRFPFIIEKEGPAFESLLPGLPNKSFQIPRKLKPYYHSLCVLSGNFSCILWHHCLNFLEKICAIPNEDVMPYMQQIFENIAQDHTKALTGPLLRNDRQTIDSNLIALHEQSDPFAQIYAAFDKIYNKEKSHESIFENE